MTTEETEKEQLPQDSNDDEQGCDDGKGSKSAKPRTSVYKDELQELRKKASQADEYLDNLRRLQAEFANFRKRWEKEKQQIVLYAEEELIKELLPLIDNLQRAIDAAKKAANESSLLQGITIVRDQLMETLRKRGLERIESTGRQFDPNIHEAVSQSLTDELPDNTIIDEMQPGYMLHSRLLRPAMVRVSRMSH